METLVYGLSGTVSSIASSAASSYAILGTAFNYMVNHGYVAGQFLPFLPVF